MKAFALVTSFVLALPLVAAPAKGGAADAVAEGYPAWTGVTPKNYILGRTLLSNAELRQRAATVIVEFDADKAAEQLELTGSIAGLMQLNATIGMGSSNWETLELPRDVLVVYVAKNVKSRDAFKDVLKFKEPAKQPGIVVLSSDRAPIYENVTFEGAPDAGGKYPFVYALGYEGKDPIFKGTWEKKSFSALRKAITEQRKKLEGDSLTWRPYYGYVTEPKHFGKDIEKAMSKGKPLDVVEAKLLKNVLSKDAETAKEAQMLYDGLEQTKCDLIWQVSLSYSACPHVAAYRLSTVLKYWPKMKKQVAAFSDKIKANGDAQPLIKMYAKIAQWSDPNFTCKNASEAKKIVAELQKMKKAMAPLTNDKNVTVQNGALILDGILDELITVMPAKVPQK